MAADRHIYNIMLDKILIYCCYLEFVVRATIRRNPETIYNDDDQSGWRDRRNDVQRPADGGRQTVIIIIMM